MGVPWEKDPACRFGAFTVLDFTTALYLLFWLERLKTETCSATLKQHSVAAARDIQLSPRETALLAQRVEHRYAGVNCGIMDQLAICFGKEGHALLLDCRTLEHEHVPLPEGHAIVVVDNGISRDLAASACNERRAAVERAAEVLTRAMGAPGERTA